jgi:transcriptional regulator with XRE-family HTH domain
MLHCGRGSRWEGRWRLSLQSPTVRRRRLGQELRTLRDSAGLTLDDVAERLEVSPAKVSRIETGRVSVRPRDVADLLDLYGIKGTHRDNLITLTREARQRGWWHTYSDVLTPGTEVWVGLETEAVAMRLYEVQQVPGLLQSEEYARAILRAHYRSESIHHVERRVQLRMARQQLIVEENAPQLWAVLDESVLRRVMGAPDVMQSQYRRLIDLSEKNHVIIQVLPFEAGVYSGVPGGFAVIQLPHPDPEVVVTEYRGGTIYLERPEDVHAHIQVFDRIRATARSPEESISFIANFVNNPVD